MKLSGFAEVFTGTIIILRASPDEANSVTSRKELLDPAYRYRWSLFALVNPETGKAEIQAVADPLPITKETVEWVLSQITSQGYEPEWLRMGVDGPYAMRLTKGPNGELRMSKTYDKLASVHAHDHITGKMVDSVLHQTLRGVSAHAHVNKQGNGIDQAVAVKTITDMRALHKAGKTRIVFGNTMQCIDEKGTLFFETTLKAVQEVSGDAPGKIDQVEAGNTIDMLLAILASGAQKLIYGATGEYLDDVNGPGFMVTLRSVAVRD